MNMPNMNKLKQIFCNLNYHWCKRLSRHKSAEVEAYSGLIGFSNKVCLLLGSRGIYSELSILYALFRFELNVRWKTDHAGVSIWFGLLGFDVGLHFHDTRHWDNENDRWEVYEEDGE